MARPTSAPRRPLRRLVPLVAGIAAVATVGTLAVVLDGYDAQEVPALSTSVWVSRESGQYARVNTELAEIDTVRTAEEPDAIVQFGDAGMVFTQGLSRAWAIDPARPGDLGSTAGEDGRAPASSEATPGGTRQIEQAGAWVVYRTETGNVYLGGLPVDGKVTLPSLVDPYRDLVVPEDEERPTFVSTAVAVDETGLVAMYSAAERVIRLYDGARDVFRDRIDLPAGPDADADVQLALAQGRWALLDDDGLLWMSGRGEPIDTGVAGGVLQASSTATARVHVAGPRGLVAVDPGSGQLTELATASGVAARPVLVAGEVVAAWLSNASGRLWTPAGPVDLTVPEGVLEDVDNLLPVLRTNGDRAVLSEQTSGMLWRVPDGTPIPVEEWSLEDDERDEGTIQVDDVAEQEPPVAEPDVFGVRPGALVTLPVLLNDHDPNKKDVLTIAPDSLQQPFGFGTVSLAADNQQAVVRVGASSGSATFSYAVTDGVSVSAPTTVTLTVVSDDVNTAPEWCGVEGCVQEWPSPGISAGGTVRVPVLAGWVDHEGDVVILSDAVKDDPSAPVTVLATADGDVVVRHQDPNAPDAVIPITVTVADARGATATRTLEVRVTGNPALVAEPIAAVAGVNEKISVDVAKHVRGGSGSFSIVDAVQTSTGSGLVVVPNAAAGRIELTGSAPGDYAVTYTVQDLQTLAQQSALLRVTVVAGGAPLSIAPITAFVRANEDTTVDVLGAVQNTTGRVLIVSEATSSTPSLGVSVVGQARLRVSGTTADGLPGRVGTASVTVTDGAGNSVQGTVTVFLVAPSTTTGPIAVPDTVTVRAGAQADIRVLANDVSPRGERVVLHPDLQGSGTEGELAFSAGDRVRYLAPTTPGVYTLRYSVYLENAPELLDSATVTVTVLPPGANRDPQPPILTARVVAGQSVAIPFSGSGVDPDGDRVVLADVSQPASGQGIAEISAEGDAIVYRAPANGVSGGQVSFAYRVRDAEGATAEGIVRVGVLATDVSDVAPVTYGDYVRAQAGTPTPLTVSPLLNDRDPLQGRLELQSVVPNAPPGSPEYERLLGLLDVSGLEEGEVRVQAGTALGVHSYIYTVLSTSSFSTAEGLIVVNVTDAPSPDAPLVTDTVVTAQNRGQLATGIDVVSGKVQWASGDVAGLELAIWGPAASRYTVSGRTIAGTLPRDGDIVPFSLTGESPSGAAVVAYGFLRIPAFDDMRVQLRRGADAISVPEEQSRTFDVRELLDLVAADEIELRGDDEYPVQRGNATCAPASGTSATYAAGREAPWSDTCTVPVRIVGQQTWTMLGVPVLIEPKDPQAILNSISRTFAPGTTQQIDLYADMTTWEGGRVGDTDIIEYRVAYEGASFLVTETTDGVVEITVRANAVPGTREAIQVSVDAYGGLRAGIALVVGIAPPDAPRGATFTQECDVSRGPSCTIVVVDKPGEYDPFAGKVDGGLRVVGVGTSASGGTVTCPVATVRVSDERQLVATWPAAPKPAGGECVVTYTVADAQNRTGQGTLTIDVQGYPQKPASLTTTAYTPTSVTMRVDLGEARNAHPAVTGVVILEAGVEVAADCAPTGGDYYCTVSGLSIEDKHTYTARAVNAVGQSLDTTALTTWSYRKPRITGTPTAQSVYAGPGSSPATTPSQGVVELGVASEDDALRFRVYQGSTLVGEFDRAPAGTTIARLAYTVDTYQLSIVPVSRFTPPLSGETNTGDPVTVTARFVGAPSATASGSAQSNDDGTTLTLTGAAASANNSPESARVVYYVWDTGTPVCAADADGDAQVTGALRQSTSPEVGADSALTPNREYFMAACISYGFGAVSTGAVEAFTLKNPGAPAGVEFHIDTDPGSGPTQVYGFDRVTQTGTTPDDFELRFRIGGAGDWLASAASAFGPTSVTSFEAAYCALLRGAWRCGEPVAVGPSGDSVPAPVRIVFPSVCSEDPLEADDVEVSVSSDYYEVDIDVESLFFPFGATRYSFTVTWLDGFGAYSDLDTAQYSYTCN